MEKWRADREGWCARTDDSLTSLSENARALTRRAHNQQKALDEAAVEQEDLAASLKTARKAGDAAAAAAVAPVRVRRGWLCRVSYRVLSYAAVHNGERDDTIKCTSKQMQVA